MRCRSRSSSLFLSISPFLSVVYWIEVCRLCLDFHLLWRRSVGHDRRHGITASSLTRLAISDRRIVYFPLWFERISRKSLYRGRLGLVPAPPPKHDPIWSRQWTTINAVDGKTCWWPFWHSIRAGWKLFETDTYWGPSYVKKRMSALMTLQRTLC